MIKRKEEAGSTEHLLCHAKLFEFDLAGDSEPLQAVEG